MPNECSIAYAKNRVLNSQKGSVSDGFYWLPRADSKSGEKYRQFIEFLISGWYRYPQKGAFQSWLLPDQQAAF